MVIRVMRRLGLAWDVVLIAPERQQQKLAGRQAPAPAAAAPAKATDSAPEAEERPAELVL